jgi:amino acid adenylation domain-containing protein
MEKYSNILLSTGKYRARRDYWIKNLYDLEVEQLIRSSSSHTGASSAGTGEEKIEWSTAPEAAAQLIKLSRHSDVTLNIVLLSAFLCYLYKYTGREDIFAASPVYSEMNTDSGYLFNDVVVFRQKMSPRITFKDMLMGMKEKFLQVCENQDYPFDKLVEELNLTYKRSYDLLFDVIFACENIHNMESIRGKSSGLSVSFLRTGGEIRFTARFNKSRYHEEEIKGIIKYFNRMVQLLVENLSVELSCLDLLDEEEKKKVLWDFNNTKAEFPTHKTIHQLFEEQAARTPDHTAAAGHSTTHMTHITYSQLNKRSNQMACLLKEKGVKPGSIAAITAERCIETIAGILGILKAGGAYLPIEPGYPDEGIAYMLADSGAKIFLTNLSESHHSNYQLSMSSLKAPLHHSSFINHHSGDLAYVIYTSGSTGRPRGVLIEHGSVINLVFAQIKTFNIDERERVLQFSPLCFDASVEQVFISFFSGAVLVLVDKAALLDIDAFEKYISRHCVTHLHAVPSFLNDIRPGDSYSLKRVVSGGDVCLPSLALKWSKCCDFYNEYGPTETTVTSIEFQVKTPGESRCVPIGRPIANTTVYILDKRMQPFPPGAAGELYIGGAGLARGYLNNPELTAEKFIFLFNKSDRSDKSERSDQRCNLKKLYRTGDLARWLPDGNIEFLGRIDSQVKIRGFRIEPGEIENQLLNHEDIKEAVVTAGEEKNSEKYLCAYIVPQAAGTYDFSRLSQYLQRKLPAYMVPSYFVILKEIPLTVTGKVDRKSLPQPDKVSTGDYIAPRNEVEKTLVEIWSEVLGIEKEIIGIDANFFRLGGHSLKAAALVSRIHKILNVRVPISEVFQLAAIRKLAEYIHGTVSDPYASIEAAKEKEYYALSSAQKRLYILHQVDGTSTRFNMSTAMRIKGAVDKDKLEDTFKQLIRRHESFRTSFEIKENEPVQIIHQNAVFALEYFHLADIVEEKEKEKIEKQVVKNFFRGFDLSKAPLLKAGLVKRAAEEYILMVDMHHIISDEASVNILEREFWALYAGEELPMLGLQYKDYSEWQNRLKDFHWIRKQEEYWLDQYKDAVPVLDLPLDYPRPAVVNYEGSRICFEIDREKTAGLKRMVLETETTLFILLLAAYNVLLSKYSGQEDIVVGSPAANRGHPDLENIIGLFANMLAIRNQPQKEKTFAEFLQDVKVRALNAYENQEYQFEMLVWKLKLKADSGRNPLFDAAFVLQNAAAKEKELNKPGVVPYAIEQEKVHNELILVVSEGNEKLALTLDYSTELFKESTAWRIAAHYVEILEQILGHRDIRLEDIRISHGFAAAEPGIIRDDESDFRL